MSEYERGWDAATADYWMGRSTRLSDTALEQHSDEWIDGYEAFVSSI